MRFRAFAQTLVHLGHRAKIQLAQALRMVYSISPKRAVLLEENFFEFSSQDRVPDRALFDSITAPAELHYLADIYNWDDGAEVLRWIIDSPYCDRGTAALIFWRSQPEYYTQFTNDAEATWAADVYALLRRIILNWENGKYGHEQISYDPKTDQGAPRNINERNPQEKWPIPDYLKLPTKGKTFLFR